MHSINSRVCCCAVVYDAGCNALLKVALHATACVCVPVHRLVTAHGMEKGFCKVRCCSATTDGACERVKEQFQDAVDAAAAMDRLVEGWAKCCITVDPDSGRVSYQHDDCCVICSVREPFFQFVKIGGLPPSFLDLKQAQFLADIAAYFNMISPVRRGLLATTSSA